MRVLFELSKEYKILPNKEIISCLNAEKIKYKIIELTDDYLVISTNVKTSVVKNLSERLSLTYYIYDLLFSCPIEIGNFKKIAINNPIHLDGSIAIKYRNRSNHIDSQSIIHQLADVYTKDRIVNLSNPDIEIRALITDSKLNVGVKICKINRGQFEDRKVQHRPYFSPISLHPKIARTLVNISEINTEDRLLDPFCGTGGILLEAGLMGIKVIGSDIEEEMIAGCKKTFDFYKIKNYELFCSDIGDINKYINNIDVVVTDFPYGKATTTKGEDKIELYKRAFSSIHNILSNGNKAVIGVSDKNIIPLGENYFSLIDEYKIRVHRSLTRYFIVYQK
jgi:tRNA (guanine10-N2)-dimethyltransferase